MYAADIDELDIVEVLLDEDDIGKAFVKTGTETSGNLDALVALNAAKDAADELDEAEYTPTSWAALDAALAMDEDTAAEMKDKARAINNAIKGLVERADFSALTSLIADAQQLAEETDVDDDVTPAAGTVTTAVMEALEAAIEVAEGVEANLDSTQAEVNAAVTALQTAITNFNDAVVE